MQETQHGAEAEKVARIERILKNKNFIALNTLVRLMIGIKDSIKHGERTNESDEEVEDIADDLERIKPTILDLLRREVIKEIKGATEDDIDTALNRA